MTVEVLIQLIASCGIVPALFVWLLFETRKEHKEDKEKAQKREDALNEQNQKLMEHIAKSDATQSGIMRSVEQIAASQMLMQRDIEELKKG